jgi:hypothetical protein
MIQMKAGPATLVRGSVKCLHVQKKLFKHASSCRMTPKFLTQSVPDNESGGR